jgi:hypothetical protein
MSSRYDLPKSNPDLTDAMREAHFAFEEAETAAATVVYNILKLDGPSNVEYLAECMPEKHFRVGLHVLLRENEIVRTIGDARRCQDPDKVYYSISDRPIS